MYYLEILLFVIGLALIIAGYRKNNRNILLAAAIAWLAAGAPPNFMTGVEEGFQAGVDTRSDG